jgi:hypothetical protein
MLGGRGWWQMLELLDWLVWTAVCCTVAVTVTWTQSQTEGRIAQFMASDKFVIMFK